MASIKFYLKDPSAASETEIFLLFNYGFAELDKQGKKKYKPLKYYTGEKIDPQFWGKGKVRETSKFPGYKSMADRLDDITQAVKTTFRDLQNKKITPTHELLKLELDKALKGYQEPEEIKQTFFGYIEHYIETCDKKRQTKLNYGTTFRALKKYDKTAKRKLTFETIDLDFYDNFIGYLKKKDYTKNTIGSHIKNIKVFMNNALDRGIIEKWDERIRRRFVTTEEEADTIYLSQSDLDKIYEKDFSDNVKLDRLRDVFLIACNTGLRFTDLKLLKPENFIMNNTLVKISTQKGEEPVVIPVKPVITKILEKYSYELPRVISNQKFNEYLKILGQKVGLNEQVQTTKTKGGKRVSTTRPKFELMTTHTARRSFATNAFLADVPSISIMKITGHKTERAFMRYIRISKEENAMKLMQHPFFSNLQVEPEKFIDQSVSV